MILCGSASYRSFSVRSAMAIPVYRSRALWTGVVAAIAVAFNTIQLIVENVANLSQLAENGPLGPSLWVLLFVGSLTVAGSLVIFSWIDSTTRVALELDFLHRDALQWKRFRRYTWGVVVVGAVGAAGSTTGWEYAVSVSVLGLGVAYAVSVLIMSGLRVKYVPMKAYMKSMGLAVVALIVELAASVTFFTYLPLAFFAYFLYRAATSLSTTRASLTDAGGKSGRTEG
jgi:hypothetical protein